MVRVSTIPAGVPFVDALASGLLAEADGDALALADMLVLLPNRRACRSLRDAFYDRSRGVVDYARLRESEEYRAYRLLTNGLRSFDCAMLLGRKEKIAF